MRPYITEAKSIANKLEFVKNYWFSFEWIHLHRAVLTWPSIWHQQSLFKPKVVPIPG